MFAHHHVAHDGERPWGADDLGEVLAELGEPPHPGLDLAEPGAPEALMAAAVDALGHVDILVCNHASSGPDGPLGELTAPMLDHHYAVNTPRHAAARAGVRRPARPPPGRARGPDDLRPEPRPDEWRARLRRRPRARSPRSPQASSDALIDGGITVNCVNPGPVDTGWPTDEVRAAVQKRMPLGWASPDDPARLIAWLVSGEGRWVTGQVLNSEGGFRR